MLEAMRSKRLKLTALHFVDRRLDAWAGAFTGNLTEVSCFFLDVFNVHICVLKARLVHAF